MTTPDCITIDCSQPAAVCSTCHDLASSLWDGWRGGVWAPPAHSACALCGRGEPTHCLDCWHNAAALGLRRWRAARKRRSQ